MSASTVARSSCLEGALFATVASVVIAMAITHGAHRKVSLHLGGIAGSVAVFVPLFEPVLLALTPLWRWSAGHAGGATSRW